MAGHSQFKNIMHRKGAQDAKRAKMFSKIGREITVATREGGPDPESNPRLRAAIQNAKGASMPRDRIERAIAAGSGAQTGDDYIALRYEGYAAGGVAVIVEALTNNRNRTAGEVRSIFAKHGGNLAAEGAVGFMFDRIGEILYPAGAAHADAMFEAALEAGADDVASDPESGHAITTAPDALASVRAALAAKFGEPEKSGLSWRANITATVSGETAQAVADLIEALEDNDDVQAVFTNAVFGE